MLWTAGLEFFFNLKESSVITQEKQKISPKIFGKLSSAGVQKDTNDLSSTFRYFHKLNRKMLESFRFLIDFL